MSSISDSYTDYYESSSDFLFQTSDFVQTLKASNSTGNTLTDDQRQAIQSISNDLNEALTEQEADGQRPILPQDLKTTAMFVGVVAK